MSRLHSLGAKGFGSTTSWAFRMWGFLVARGWFTRGAVAQRRAPALLTLGVQASRTGDDGERSERVNEGGPPVRRGSQIMGGARQASSRNVACARSTEPMEVPARPPQSVCVSCGVCVWVVAGSGCALVATDRAFRMWGFLVARGWLQEELLRNDEPRRYHYILRSTFRCAQRHGHL